MDFTKKLSIIFLVIFTLTGISLIFSPKNAQALTNKPGDIIVTKNTSSKGILGHTGIFISKDKILHTSGWKKEPYPKLISKKNWGKRYGNSKVVRPESSALGKKAANNAIKYFKNKKIPYSISASLKSNKKAYCSQLVWYSYYKSGKSFKILEVRKDLPSKWITPGSILPYDFLNYEDYNGFKTVDDKW
ncbi:hypothetical protein [Rummeliibacillus suwonensis]|uniref:hypothetical protein n=1 Tax=Rummeliibacillus suwonensis TaxID=1306154 RepID=UPI0028978947|nr:hypothetical protein [Rummeliibacillus suwonensis]